MVTLQSFYESNADLACEQRILAVGFVATAPTRVSEYIDVWSPEAKASIPCSISELYRGVVLSAGFVGDGERSEQTELALLTVRALISLVPMALLLLAIVVATRYPLTREVHAEILEGLARRREWP